MSECLCETCPLGAPNLTYAAVHCLHRFSDWPEDRSRRDESATLAGPATSKVWQASEAMPHLFFALAA